MEGQSPSWTNHQPGHQPPFGTEDSTLTSSSTAQLFASEVATGRRPGGRSEQQRITLRNTATADDAMAGYWQVAFGGSNWSDYLPFDATPTRRGQ